MEYNLPDRVEISNKSTYGRVLNIAGSDYMPGAAYLSSTSALKMGCGYCFLATSEDSRKAVSSQTQSIVFVPLSKIDEYIKNSDVVEFGCGIGTDDYGLNLFNHVIDNCDINKPLVVDADGLNIISRYPEKFLSAGFKNVLFTPHPKEASRLLGVSSDEILEHIQESAKQISVKYNCVTVLKTHKTYVYSPDGRDYTNTTGNNSMAKAGSGDVLSGFISGLIAQKTDLFEAACLGVYLHGLCGDIAKEKLTQYCVLPADLISFLPEAIKLYLNSKI